MSEISSQQMFPLFPLHAISPPKSITNLRNRLGRETFLTKYLHLWGLFTFAFLRSIRHANGTVRCQQQQHTPARAWEKRVHSKQAMIYCDSIAKVVAAKAAFSESSRLKGVVECKRVCKFEQFTEIRKVINQRWELRLFNRYALVRVSAPPPHVTHTLMSNTEILGVSASGVKIVCGKSIFSARQIAPP